MKRDPLPFHLSSSTLGGSWGISDDRVSSAGVEGRGGKSQAQGVGEADESASYPPHPLSHCTVPQSAAAWSGSSKLPVLTLTACREGPGHRLHEKNQEAMLNVHTVWPPFPGFTLGRTAGKYWENLPVVL